jgi:hypothetical protein
MQKIPKFEFTEAYMEREDLFGWAQAFKVLKRSYPIFFINAK